ncbi:integrase [Desulfopila sp. IMCC35006]|uniref:site-specific integrase n=1 Tax=Desulfopila sp. IMCC35006 TaxID=2569542 RepID=UPI0010ACD940|nr:site-specific integrase [Desulfopila sp. IMCC35006]TKB23082.1 integrase [Desulfopila sp. IMCC35006]
MTKLYANSDLSQGMDNGPLGCIIPAYAALLSEQGYTEHSAYQQLRFLNDMSQWLHQQRIQVVDLSGQTIHRYIQSRHQRFGPRRDEAAILRRLVQLLHAHCLLPVEATRIPDNPRQQIENDYDCYLSEERGLSVSTRVNYRLFIQRFLSFQYGDNSACLADLKAENVIRFIQNQAGRLSPKRAALMVTALRSFFRYLHYRGDITKDLAACVPTIPNWQFSTLPKFLQPGQVQQVLSQCDRSTAQGRRDYAILLLLARLGLRACEIVSMTLDDIHWQVGEISIQGKGNRSALLPLPPDVGQAVADYLEKDRPTCSTRSVFIRMKAPRRGFANSEAISTIVARTLKKAGIDSPHTGAHLFRHTFATEMLRGGATLAEIALLLRHSSINTTTLYAKVDLTALQTLAQPWPGGAK